ncbi:hypothetical protein C8Q72DRAFT_771510 [Fomitopsis betulina]|nr:hypothetical protein C8Q72DRAFT_771510 [Fomitopsis betulina]
MDDTEDLDGDRPPPTIQLGIYASEMLSVKGMNRAHTLGMLTQNDWTWLWYYNSAGAIQTQGFNIWAHTADFVLILMLLRRFNLYQWGFPREANSKAKLTAVLDGVSLPESSTGPGSATGTASATATPLTGFDMSAVGSDSKDKSMRVDHTSCIFDRLPVLAGRRTTVYDAHDPADHEAHYVAKWSYPQCKRNNEAKVVWIARKILVNDPEALSALTEVVAYKDFEEVSTDTIRTHLRQFANDTESLIDDHGHGERILRCIFEKKLEPLRYLSGVWFVRGMHNCVRAHYLLWKGNGNRKVEHTDISDGNYGVDPKTLEIKLRDFDLARVIDSCEASLPQGTERTGTIPYMALDLLTREYWEGTVRRLYRHDAEGTVWVIAAQAWLYNKNGVEVECSEVDAWFTADYEQCQAEKTDFLNRFKALVPNHHADIPDLLNLARYVLTYVHRAAFARLMNARRDWWADETTIPEAATVVPEAATKQSNPLGLTEDDVKEMDSTFHNINRCFERVLPRKRVLRLTDSDIKRFEQRKHLWAKRAGDDGRISSAT